MTNEAVMWFETGPPIPFTVANATGIEKGAILKMTDPMTAIISSGTNDVVAGIAAKEKIASDGNTKLAVYRQGIFKVIASGSITTGDALGIAGIGSLNYVYSLAGVVSISNGVIIGTALETATDEQTFLMELRPQSGANYGGA